MVGKKFLTVAAGATLASASCAPGTGSQLAANPVISPSGSDTPTIGQPFTVLYDGTGLGPSLTFDLLMGPAANIADIGVIAAGVSNCGTASCTFTWTPDCSLASTTTNMGYGIKMTDDATCSFQYTTQFGLNAGTTCNKPSSSAAAPPPASSSAGHPVSSAPSKPSSMPAPSGNHTAPPPSGSPHPGHGGGDDEGDDCDDNGNPTWSTSWKPASPTGGYTPPGYTPGGSTPPPKTNGTATNGTAYQPPVGGASPTYTGPKSNDAQSFAVSGVSAVIALAAAVMLL